MHCKCSSVNKQPEELTHDCQGRTEVIIVSFLKVTYWSNEAAILAMDVSVIILDNGYECLAGNIYTLSSSMDWYNSW